MRSAGCGVRNAGHADAQAWRSIGELGDGGAKMRPGIVPEFGDQRMPIERPLDLRALNPPPASVDQPDFPEAGGVRRAHILFHDIDHITGGKGMQVERRLNRQFVHCPSF